MVVRTVQRREEFQLAFGFAVLGATRFAAVGKWLAATVPSVELPADLTT